MKLPISGGMYEHASKKVNFQRCVNLFPAARGLTPQEGSCLFPTAGMAVAGSVSGKKEVRALLWVDDYLYTIVEDKLYKGTINSDTRTITLTSLGSINSSTGRVQITRNLNQLFIPDGNYGWVVPLATDALTLITDADFPGAASAAYLDGYVIFHEPSSQVMWATAINDASDIDALDFTSAETNTDKIVALEVDKQELWVFGQRSVEVWWDSANATGFPLTKRPDAHIDQGCGAQFSVAKFDNTLVWLDDRGFVVRARGYMPEVISTEPMNKEIKGYKRIDDAVAWTYLAYGHLFYVLSFPTVNKTWSFDAVTGLWHEMGRFLPDGSFGRHYGNCSATYKQLYTVVGCHTTGRIYIMDKDVYTDAGEAIHRLRTTPNFYLDRTRYTVKALEIICDVGYGTDFGYGSDPKLELRYSVDAGHTWSNSLPASLGLTGEWETCARWTRLGSGREWAFELSFSDPIPFCILDAELELIGGFEDKLSKG